MSFFIFGGVFVSRIGSLLIEMLAIKIKFVKYAPYGDYLMASRNDPDLKMFLEVNNMLRTFSAVFLCLLVVFFVVFF